MLRLTLCQLCTCPRPSTTRAFSIGRVFTLNNFVPSFLYPLINHLSNPVSSDPLEKTRHRGCTRNPKGTPSASPCKSSSSQNNSCSTNFFSPIIPTQSISRHTPTTRATLHILLPSPHKTPQRHPTLLPGHRDSGNASIRLL